MVSQAEAAQIAPGRLEEVRELLNTWFIPNDSRNARDDLEGWLIDRKVPRRQWPEVLRFRDELRGAVDDTRQFEPVVNAWIARYRILPVVSGDVLAFISDGTVAGELASIVVSVLESGQISRLKACPDCHWVFYDNTRNGSKKWCMMNAAGPLSRGCGNIAKARRHRARVRSAG